MSKRIDLGGGRIWRHVDDYIGWVEMLAEFDAAPVTSEDVEFNRQIRRLTPAEVERAERGLGPLMAQSVTVRDAAGEVIYRDLPDDSGTTYTRAQLAAAVDKAHAYIHSAEADLAAAGVVRPADLHWAHEALHRVGAGMPRVAAKKGV